MYVGILRQPCMLHMYICICRCNSTIVCTYTCMRVYIHICANLQFYIEIYMHIYIYMLPPPPQRSTKINAIRDILGYFHPHSSDHDDSDRWWTSEDMYISWFHSDVSDGSVKQ